MKEIYKKLWESAKPYYEKGRVYDIPHIEWMMKEIDRIAKIENLNEDLLMPIAILHDVGYSVAGHVNPNIKCPDSKQAHMIEGAKIAEKILAELEYDKELSQKIVRYISVHDNWILGDDAPFKECKEMGVFNDLDFLWGQSSFEVFRQQAESMGKGPEEMHDFWAADEKLTRRPFACEATKKMFGEYMSARKKETDDYLSKK